VDIHDNARKHGYEDDDLRHAVRNAIRIVPHSPDPRRDLVIGATRGGVLLELVVEDMDSEDAILIHAMQLRKKFYRYL
jgi:hypothetical protein